ncbi:Helicase-like protein [Leptomonas seymouri]|uniref:Helicase-like protein n=1 Tax=Leptomonas seymouri TaxID=5684 RepID=A0A0N0P8F0_LEPSE|nr:Helicase-like protein [Leptomonas seymouri]|eukprot:KPI89447.1 Helicase-like protein [Leptomonas seymouri]
MGSLLKDILLRHQQWEDEVERRGSVPLERELRTASTQDGALLENHSSLSTQPHSGLVASVDLAHRRAPTSKSTRYRTRPPGLRAPAATAHTNRGCASRFSPASSLTDTTVGTGVRNAAATTAASSAPLRERSSQSGVISHTPDHNSSCSAPAPTATPSALSATLALPFAAYPVQQEMCAAIARVLKSCKPHVTPVAVVEVPTGCGKTVALLSAVLQYQQELKRMTPKEAESFLHIRRPPWQLSAPNPKGKKKKSCSGDKTTLKSKAPAASGSQATACENVKNAESDDSDSDSTESGADAGWAVPRSFFKHFRGDPQRKIRAELDMTGSQALRRRFLPPPCSIYYATRTHAQLRQVVRELRRLHGAPGAIRMNILGSRERYCIHPNVIQAKTTHALPVESNNLGEVCDKLVSLGLCEMVDGFDELSCSAISGSIGHQRGQIWDMEDLILEGSARSMCPYYAARDLVFYADINFCTYPYLLDPLIRHETKMEAALKNNTIIVFDEAHNVSAVCQDALSLECPRGVLDLILSDLEPLVSNRHSLARQAATATVGSGAGRADGFATLQYPRELHLGSYTLVEIFSFLHTIFHALGNFFDKVADARSAEPAGSAAHTFGHASGHRGEKRPRDGEGVSDEAFIQGEELEHHLRGDMEAFMRTMNTQAGTRKRSSALGFLDLFQRAYGVIMSLGVTFNPFLFSVFGLSMLKRWLLLLRFLLQKPRSFVLTSRNASQAEDTVATTAPTTNNQGAPAGLRERRQLPGAETALLTASGSVSAASRTTIEVRCLDGSLAFQHLLRSVHRVVLASGTLAPFTQLAQDLGLTSSQWEIVEGLHVVPPTQYRLAALTSLPSCAASNTTVPLRCTYASLSSPSFLKAVARCVVQLARTVQRSSSNGSGGGGVLFFVPNYGVLHSLATITRELLRVSSQDPGFLSSAPPIPLFLEPRKAEELTQVLHQFRCHTQGPKGGTALFFSVYRGKVSEGIDFTDDMARLVVCLGVPLQPLKSWKVVAQRAYSGPEWYTSDAVRAVNQALGRCLRHARDYGAVVLLDERYAQAEYQQRLSRWCRAVLRTDSSLADFCSELQGCFAHWHRGLGTSSAITTTRAADGGVKPADTDEGCVVPSDTARASAASSAISGKCGLEVESQLSNLQMNGLHDTRARLGTDQLPFQVVDRTALHRVHHVRDRTTAHTQMDGNAIRGGNDSAVSDPVEAYAAGARVGNGLLQSPVACTAIKLLYEAASSTGDVSRRDLHAAVALLEETFAEEDVGGRTPEWIDWL